MFSLNDRKKLARKVSSYLRDRDRLRVLRASNSSYIAAKFSTLPFKVRLLIYAFWFVLVAQFAYLAINVITPLIEQEFSPESLRNFVVQAYLIVVGVPFLMFCLNTPLKHLSSSQKVFVDLLLYLGALTFLASGLLLGFEYYFSFVVVGLSAVIVILYARAYALLHA
jgi:hypothetical protein